MQRFTDSPRKTRQRKTSPPKKIGVIVRKIAREQANWKQNKIKIMQVIKKLFENAHGHVIIVIIFIQKGITTKNIFQNSSSNWVRYAIHLQSYQAL